MPSTGLSLRSSLHLSHLESCLPASKIFSILPVSTPPASVMRTSDFSVLPSSSIVFHRPTGVVCADADDRRQRQSAGQHPGLHVSLLAVVAARPDAHQNNASSISISGARPARALRISAAVSGSSLAK